MALHSVVFNGFAKLAVVVLCLLSKEGPCLANLHTCNSHLPSKFARDPTVLWPVCGTATTCHGGDQYS